MRRTLYLPLFCALLAVPSLAKAEAPSSDVAADPVPLTDDQLDEQRGGFSTPNGVQFGFGAVVETYVDGQMVMRSQLTWTPQGPVQTQSGTITPQLSAAAAAAGIKLSPDASGTFVPGTNGGTVVLNNLNPNQVVNTVINTADNRDIRQNTTVNLNIPDLAQYQAATNATQMALKIQDGITSAIGSR